MKKFLVHVLIVGAAFWAGHYVGQQPPEEVKKQLRELSQEVIEQTIGLEEGELFLQKKVLILQAKSAFLNSKAKILDGKYDEAITELDETLDYLKHAAKMKGQETSDALHGAISKIGDLQRSLANGQAISQEKFEEAQEKLDSLLQA